MGTDLGLALSLAANANSGARVDAGTTINNGRGPQIPPWFLFGALAAGVLVLVAWVFRH